MLRNFKGRLFIMLVLIFGAFSIPTFARADTNKMAIQRLVDEGINGNDSAIFDELLAEGYLNHGYGEDLDKAAFVEQINALHAALPDFKATIEVIISEEDWVASRLVYTGTFENEWVEGDTRIESNNEKLTWTLHVLHRFDAEGRLVEDFTAFNRLDLLRQMGASPLSEFWLKIVPAQEYVPIVMETPDFEPNRETQEASLVHIIEDAINNGELTAIDTYMIEGYQAHEPLGSLTRQQFRDVIAGFRTLVPDLHVDITNVVIEGDWLFARLIYSGTLTGEFPGISALVPSEGQSFSFVVNVFIRFNEEGIGIEDYKEYNLLGWFRQLGIIAASE